MFRQLRNFATTANKSFVIASLLSALVTIPVMGQSVFNGTWRANNGSMEYQGSNQYSLQQGIWRCDTCVPKIAIKADGRDHRVNGSLYYGAPYADTENVREINDRSVDITDKLDGRVVAMNKLTTSNDGKVLTTEWKSISNNGKENSGQFDSERVGVAPAGANKVSGRWRPVITNTSEDEVTVTYEATADGLAMTDPDGDSYTAKFDGREYPFNGDPGITGVSLKKINENTIVETDIRKGRVISVCRMTVDRDGRKMKVTVEDKLRNARISWTADKQSGDSEVNPTKSLKLASATNAVLSPKGALVILSLEPLLTLSLGRATMVDANISVWRNA